MNNKIMNTLNTEKRLTNYLFNGEKGNKINTKNIMENNIDKFFIVFLPRK